MKKILLTGSTGFIGSNILLTLKNNKYKIYVTIHKTKYKIKYRNISYKCNLLKYKDCFKATKNIDIVIHCAATTSGSKDIINKPYLHVTDNAVAGSYLTSNL